MKNRLTVALAGNPNSGKTTLFNNLTGARQHVGNYPGVTVEKKEGVFTHRGCEITLVDLPGTYSLTAFSAEERVARHFLMQEKPDLVVAVVDASNLERHLYLAVQVMELGLPVVFAFNMIDLARAQGFEFDLERLSTLLGGAIVPTVGRRREGMEALADAIVDAAARAEPRVSEITYGAEIEAALDRIRPALRAERAFTSPREERWSALKLLESDPEIAAQFAAPETRAAVAAAQAHVQAMFRDPPEIVIADRRYGFISGACQEAVRSHSVEWRHTMSDKIDAALTHPVLGLPIFLGMMYLVFMVSFRLGEPPMRALEHLFGWLGAHLGALWPAGSESALRSLAVNGIVGGVGGVVSFLPNIVLLFAAIAVLEDSGYMARAAFVMDRLMHRMGLHGKSFIPLLIGFGCSVPAIMATRTLESRRDRLTTMLIVPLMSCGGRLPIYALIIPAFFPAHWQAPVLWLIYFIGIVLAVGAARLLRATLFRGETDPLVMELPPYRLPTARSVLIHMGERGWLYLQKAGTIILAISIVLWALVSYPRLPAAATAGLPPAEARAAQLAHTAAGRLGRALEPALRPMGMDWRAGTAMIGAFAAKEVFVAQLGIVFAVGEAENAGTLRQKLRAHYSPLSGFCMMLFMLIATPCVATVVVTRRESGSWRWALLQLGGLTALGWILTTLVYQAGHALGL